MLKQRKSWYNLEENGNKIQMDNENFVICSCNNNNNNNNNNNKQCIFEF